MNVIRDAGDAQRNSDISALLNFKSIALVGASDSSNFGKGAWRALSEIGFEGRYFPVNPKRDAVHGQKAYKRVCDILEPVDAVVIATASQHVMPAVRDCVEKGVKAIVVLSSNFAEAGAEGCQLQEELTELVQRNGIALIGPNCLGVASPANKCALFQGRGLGSVRAGNVGLVSQTGGLLIETVAYGTTRGVGFSHMFSMGNEAATRFEDVLEYLVDDPATEVLVAAIETSRDPIKFKRVADKALAAGKPLIMLKLGVSDKGAKSAQTHTGAMTGSARSWEAIMRQKGIVSARDVDELIDLIALFSGAVKKLRKRSLEGIGVLEISGGATELVCDLAEASGVELPDLSADGNSDLRAVLPSFLSIGNPLDLGVVWVDPQMATMYPAALDAFAHSDAIDVIVSRYIVPPSGELGGLADRVTELKAARERYPDKLFIVMTPTSERFSDKWTTVVGQEGIPFLQGLGRGISALGKLANYSRMLARTKPEAQAPTFERPSATIAPPADATVLSEVASKDILRNVGLPTVQTELAASAEAAVEIATRIGFPVVAKIVSPQLTHKSDVGGVKLNIADADELRATFAQFQELVLARPGAQFEGVSVQPMAKSGLELIIGGERDPQLGPVILFGLGGIFVEVLNDTTLRVAPFDRAEALAMTRDIRSAALLEGIRGQSGVDIDAIADALVRVGELMMKEPAIDSIDLNPAFAYPDGLAIVDARISLSPA